MPLLLQVELKDVLHNLDARRMLLRGYFELEEYDALDSLLDSFSRYIHRQKEIGGYHRINYLNLIHFVKRLIKLKDTNQASLNNLRHEIEGAKNVAEQEWLLTKVKKLQD